MVLLMNQPNTLFNMRNKGIKGANELMSAVTKVVGKDPSKYLGMVLDIMEKVKVLENVSQLIRESASSTGTGGEEEEIMSSSEASPVVYKSVDELYTEAVNLRDKFQELLEKLNQSLKDVDNDRLKLKLNWHLTCEKENTHQVKDILKEIDDFTSPLKVLYCLIRSNLIGYLNYRLLDVFQGLINDTEVDGMITKYEEAHEIFLKSSDLETLAQLFLDHPTLAPETFAGLPRFTVHLDKEWEKKSAYQWSQLLKTRFNHWPPHIHIVMITKKCIIIEYSVLPCNATDIVRDLSDSQVLSTHGVTETELSEQLREMGRNDQFDRQPLPLDDFQLDSLSDLLISIPSEDSKELITDQSTTATEHTHSDEEGLEPSYIKKKNNSLLEAAKRAGMDTETISTLLKQDAFRSSYTPLHRAAKSGKKETIELLLKEGAVKDINRKNILSETPLHYAAENGDDSIIEILIQYGATVDEKDNFRETPLHYAAINGHDSIIEILVQYGATVDEKDIYGETPLYKAAIRGKKTTVELLLKYKADYSIQSNDGDTMLHIAAKDGNTEIVELFLKLCGTSDLHKVGEYGCTQPLHHAAKSRKKETVELLLKEGAAKDTCINTKNKFGDTPLHLAARYGHNSIMEILIQYGATVDEKDMSGYTLLHHAARQGRKTTVELLLKYKADYSIQSESGDTMLHIAAKDGNTEIVELFLKLCGTSDLHKVGEYGCTQPLHHAAERGKKETMELLLKEGAAKDTCINTKNKSGDTPLHCAALYGYDSIIEILIQYGATVDEKDKDGYTLLHLAASWGRKTTVELLLKYKANYSIQSDYSDTMLHSAAYGGNTEIVELFLELCGTSDLHKVNNNGYTPLHCAVSRGHMETVELLLKSGANVDGMKECRLTPLHVAADKNHVDIAELLLKAGANVHSKDKGGCTPLHHAAQKGHKRIVELLLKYGANINEKDESDFTPLHLAVGARAQDEPQLRTLHVDFSPEDTVRILLSNGAKVNEQALAYRRTPLHYVAREGNKRIVGLLLKYGANINKKDEFGFTPLHLAVGARVDYECQRKDDSTSPEATVRMLVSNGANINEQDHKGRIPMYYSRRFIEPNQEIFKMLSNPSVATLSKSDPVSSTSY